MQSNFFKFIDLFAGLGGFHSAAAELGGECVFASEIDSELRKLYFQNFGFRPNGDIREIAPSDIPPHKLLCAGFPCQPFSKAGAQLGFEDEIRGTLIYDIIKILKTTKTEFVLLENIAHFVRHNDGKTYNVMQNELKTLDYDVRIGQLSPHQFGVPQIRERMYLVARKGSGSLSDFVFPEPETKASDLSIRTILDTNPSEARQLSEPVIECLELWQEFLECFPKDEELPGLPIWTMEFGATYPYDKADSLNKISFRKLVEYKGSFGQSLRTRSFKELLERVPSHARSKNGAFPEWKQHFISVNRNLYEKHRSWLDEWLPKIQKYPASYQKLEWHCKGEKRNIWDYIIRFRASGVRVKRPTTSPSLIAFTPVQVPIIGWEKRYMTMTEAARLQSMENLAHLPEGSKAVHALGNAVNVKVVKLIMQKLLETEKKIIQPKTLLRCKTHSTNNKLVQTA